MRELEDEINYDRLLLNEIHEYPVLSKDKINELFKDMRDLTGEDDEKRNAIRDEIVLHSLRIPLYVARKMVTKSVDVKELESEGFVGLVEAVDKYKYDYENGASFSTFAIRHIKYKLTKYLRNHSRLVRIPNYITEFVYKYNQIESELSVKFGRYPSKKEIADELGVSLCSLYRIEKQAQDILYLDEKVNRSGIDKPTTYLDSLSSEKDEIEDLTTKLSLEQLEKALKDSKIKERDVEVLKTKYGYYSDNEPKFNSEVADIFGYSSNSTIGFIEEKTIKKLRKILISPVNEVDFPICNDGYIRLK